MQNQYNTNVSYTHSVRLRHTVCSGDVVLAQYVTARLKHGTHVLYVI